VHLDARFVEHIAEWKPDEFKIGQNAEVFVLGQDGEQMIPTGFMVVLNVVSGYDMEGDVVCVRLHIIDTANKYWNYG
jgi:hypothetical protein